MGDVAGSASEEKQIPGLDGVVRPPVDGGLVLIFGHPREVDARGGVGGLDEPKQSKATPGVSAPHR